MATIPARQGVQTSISQGVNNTVQRQSVLGHNMTHTPNGADPLDVTKLGGLTADQIRREIAASRANCSTDTPLDVERLPHKGVAGGYCPLGKDTKIPRRFLPDFLIYGSFMSIDTQFPGALYVPGTTDNWFDIVRPPAAIFVVSMHASMMTPPEGSTVKVDIYVGDTLVTASDLDSNSLTLPVGSGDEFCESFARIPSDRIFLADTTKPLKVCLKAVGSTFPGEFLRVHIMARVYKVVSEG